MCPDLVLEILDLPVLGTEDLLQPGGPAVEQASQSIRDFTLLPARSVKEARRSPLLRDVGNYGRIQSCIGQDFGELHLLPCIACKRNETA